MPDSSKVVVVQLAKMGDMLQTTPLLAAVARRHGMKPVVVASAAGAEVAKASGLAGEVVAVEPARLEQEIERLKCLEPQVVYQLNFSPAARVLARVWPTAEWVGWRIVHGRVANAPWAAAVLGMAGHRRLSRVHLVDILASYAARAGAVVPGLVFVPSVEERAWAGRELGSGRFVALQLGAASPLRRWPVEWFAVVAQQLVASGWAVVLVGSAHEAPLGDRLEVLMGGMGRGVVKLMGRTSLGQLGAVLERCALVISGDTGTLHLATAVGTRVLGLFMGPAQVFETGPYGNRHIVLQAQSPCGPCVEQRPGCGGLAPCRRLIEPAMVGALAVGMAEGLVDRQLVAKALAGPMVQLYEGAMGRFGQIYRPLRPGCLEPVHALALALMEGLRILMRPGYEPGEAVEMLDWWASPTPEQADVIGQWAEMARTAGTGEVAPGSPRPLGVLARAVRMAAPRAVAAAEAAAVVLEAAAERGRRKVVGAIATAGGL